MKNSFHRSHVGSGPVSGSLQIGRSSFTANLLPNGHVFAIGGLDQSYGRLASIEEFNPASQTWRLLRSGLAIARSDHTTTLLDGSLIVAGGAGPDLVPAAELFTHPH